MSDIPHLFAVALAIVGLLASLCIWSRRRLAFRIGALVVTALYLPFAYASLVDLLSRPKPLALEWSSAKMADATVIASVMREGEAIYIWLQLPETDEPRAYVLPWDEARARELHEAKRKAEASNAQVKLRERSGEPLDEREGLFYAEPQPAPPPKETPKTGPVLFEGTGS